MNDTEIDSSMLNGTCTYFNRDLEKGLFGFVRTGQTDTFFHFSFGGVLVCDGSDEPTPRVGFPDVVGAEDALAAASGGEEAFRLRDQLNVAILSEAPAVGDEIFYLNEEGPRGWRAKFWTTQKYVDLWEKELESRPTYRAGYGGNFTWVGQDLWEMRKLFPRVSGRRDFRCQRMDAEGGFKDCSDMRKISS